MNFNALVRIKSKFLDGITDAVMGTITNMYYKDNRMSKVVD
jgi:hypothetical protein